MSIDFTKEGRELITLTAFAGASIHNKNKGAYLSLREGDLHGKAYYAVTPQRANEKRVHGEKVTAKIVWNYIREHIDLLQLPAYSLSLWYDKESECTYIDLALIFKDKKQAIQVAKDNYQPAIYDLLNCKAIIIEKEQDE